MTQPEFVSAGFSFCHPLLPSYSLPRRLYAGLRSKNSLFWRFWSCDRESSVWKTVGNTPYLTVLEDPYLPAPRCRWPQNLTQWKLKASRAKVYLCHLKPADTESRLTETSHHPRSHLISIYQAHHVRDFIEEKFLGYSWGTRGCQGSQCQLALALY